MVTPAQNPRQKRRSGKYRLAGESDLSLTIDATDPTRSPASRLLRFCMSCREWFQMLVAAIRNSPQKRLSVGAGLLAKASRQATRMSGGPTSSRASALMQGNCVHSVEPTSAGKIPRTCRSRLAGESDLSLTIDATDPTRSPASRLIRFWMSCREWLQPPVESIQNSPQKRHSGLGREPLTKRAP